MLNLADGMCPICAAPLVIVERPGEMIDRRGMCSCCSQEFATLDDDGWGKGFATYGPAVHCTHWLFWLGGEPGA